jgi:hypothetical protein
MKLNALDSTAASSFEVEDINFGGTAAESNIETGDLPPPPAPESFNDTESDDFFDQESAFSGKSDEQSPSPTDASDSGETPTDESQPANADSKAEVSIDAFKKEHKFKLDPTDEDLRRTLRRGIKAPKLKAELDTALAELKKYQDPAVKQKIEVWDELKEFASQGDYDRVFQAILGDKYEQFLSNKISNRLEYEEADPARRAEMDKERTIREYDYKDRQKEKRLQELERQQQEGRDAATLDKWEGYGVPAVEKFGFNADLIPDADRRHHLNQKLWKLSWDDIEEVAGDSPDKVTPGLVAKVFKRNAELMKYSTKVAAEAQVDKITEQKKQAAARTAAAVATAQHPKKNAPSGDMDRRVDEWVKSGAKSAKDLLKFFK